MGVAAQILCLANSRKLNGRCIAGRGWAGGRGGAWLRPVSARENQEVSRWERQYRDGNEPRVLDIIKIPLLDPCPVDWQQENWRFDPRYRWQKVGRAEWSQLHAFVDPVEPLWDGNTHTYHGTNDTIPVIRAKSLRTSLRLIHVSSLRLRVYRPGAAFGNPTVRVQGQFQHAGKPYGLRVTDALYEARYQARAEGVYDLGESYLTISLGEAYEKKDACYKLIAAIIERAEVVSK